MALKQKIRVSLSTEALVLATKLQSDTKQTLSQVIEACVRKQALQEAGRLEEHGSRKA